ncbi:hypothetical protein [Streptosporangium sp. KLBMP 9127]|nr:hypothetical protein [Streptosporangium sp. KLBMP 9127]
MNAHQLSAPPHPVADPRTPGTLKSGVILIVVAALSGIGALVVILSGGKEMLRPVLDEILKRELAGTGVGAGDLGGALVEAALADAYGTLAARGYIFTFVGVIFLLLAAFIWGRRNWARITFSIFSLIGLGLWLLDLADDGPGILKALDGVALVATLVAIVLIWLGPSNRAVRARKEAR